MACIFPQCGINNSIVGEPATAAGLVLSLQSSVVRHVICSRGKFKENEI